MKVEGDAAKGYQAVRKDSFMNAHQGELVMADDQTGEVRWKDKAGVLRDITLGPHMISIVPLTPYRR